MIINLYSFVNNKFSENAYFDFSLFEEISQDAQKLMDDLVDIELEKINKILEKINDDPESDDEKVIEKNLWLRLRKTCADRKENWIGYNSPWGHCCGSKYKIWHSRKY